MTEEEYNYIKGRLINDFWACLGHKALSMAFIVMQWGFEALGAAWPLIVAYLRKNGYFE